MKIRAIVSNYNSSTNNLKLRNSNPAYMTNPQTSDYNPGFYSDFHLSFGAGLAPEDFVKKNLSQYMPETMKTYLLEDFETRKKIEPVKLQKEAFELLEYADTVEDIIGEKGAFNDEPLFKNLKPFSKSRATRGYLYDLRASNPQNKPILKDSTRDLTVWLVNKIFSESKTLEQINADFHKSVLPEFKLLKPEYFTYKSINSLGIKYPEFSYWTSLQWTRREGNKKSIKDGIFYERKEISQETRDKMSIAQKNRYAGMSPEQKRKLILNMVLGRKNSDSVYLKYPSEIMSIAWKETGIGLQISEHIQALYADEDFLSMNFKNLSEKQKEVMESFWKTHPEEADRLSEAIISTIEKFKAAQEMGEDSAELKTLRTKALDIFRDNRERRKLKARERYRAKVADRKVEMEANIARAKKIRADFKEYMLEAVRPYPDEYSKVYSSFMSSNPQFKPSLMEKVLDYSRTLLDSQMRLQENLKKAGDNPELLEKALDEINVFSEELRNVEDATKVFNDQFDRRYMTMEYNAEQAFNEYLYKVTKNPEVMTFNRPDGLFYLQEHNLKGNMLLYKQQINESFEFYQKGISKAGVTKAFEEFILPRMIELRTEQAYSKHGPDWALAKNIFPSLISKPSQHSDMIKFMERFGGSLKFFFTTGKDILSKKGFAEKIIYEYLAENYLKKGKFIVR